MTTKNEDPTLAAWERRLRILKWEADGRELNDQDGVQSEIRSLEAKIARHKLRRDNLPKR